jgi:hypothetical protein
MWFANQHPKMTPKPGNSALHVVVIGRVSTPTQDINNIEAGYGYAEQVLPSLTDGPIETRYFGEQGSGLLVLRESILAAYEQIESGWADVVVMEDASKSYRNPRWIYAFWQDCADADVRAIAPGEDVDTWDDNWELMLGAAAFRHGMHIPDTRRRVRRRATFTFH